MWIAKCDRCGALSEPWDRSTEIRTEKHRREGWRELILTWYVITYPPKILCPECTKHLGMTGEKGDETSLGDRLIEILEEIAEGVQE